MPIHVSFLGVVSSLRAGQESSEMYFTPNNTPRTEPAEEPSNSRTEPAEEPSNSRISEKTAQPKNVCWSPFDACCSVGKREESQR